MRRIIATSGTCLHTGSHFAGQTFEFVTGRTASHYYGSAMGDIGMMTCHVFGHDVPVPDRYKLHALVELLIENRTYPSISTLRDPARSMITLGERWGVTRGKEPREWGFDGHVANFERLQEFEEMESHFFLPIDLHQTVEARMELVSAFAGHIGYPDPPGLRRYCEAWASPEEGQTAPSLHSVWREWYDAGDVTSLDTALGGALELCEKRLTPFFKRQGYTDLPWMS